MSFTASRIPAIRIVCSTSKNLCSTCTYSTYHTESRGVKLRKTNHQRKNTLLGPDKKFPFPGNVICAVAYNDKRNKLVAPSDVGKCQLENASFKISVEMPKLPANQASTSTLPSKSGDVYISKTLGELLDGMEAVVKRADNYLPAENFRSDDLIDSKSTRKVQLVITECPMLLKLELRNYFRFVDMSSRKVMLLNMVLQDSGLNELSSAGNGDSHDSSSNGDSKATAQQAILFEFIEAATNICKGIQNLGCWADFIDPRNGRPFFSSPTVTSVLECDEHYRDLGFHVEEDGGMKTVENVEWSEGKFVGTIFTDASELDIEEKILKCIEE